jgi:hypothetical protein
LVTGYDIRYNTSPITDPIWSISTRFPTWPTPVQPGNGQTHTVTGLVSSRKYYFAVKAFDERPNYSPLSNIPNGTTLASEDTTPPSRITDLDASSISHNSIELTWTAPGDDGNIGTATGYDIRYSLSEITDTTWENDNLCENEPTPQSSGSTETFIVTGIFSGLEYFFAIKSYDERPNYALLSNLASATTYWSDDIIEPGKITNLAVVETTESTATITWSAPGDDDYTGTATAYDIRYYLEPITATNWNEATEVNEEPTPKSSGETETFLVVDLEQGTTYYFAVKAADERANWSPVSNSPSGTTIGKSKPNLELAIIPEKFTLNSAESITLEVSVTSNNQQNSIELASVQISSDNPNLSILSPSGSTDTNGRFLTSITAPTVVATTTVTLTVEVSKLGFLSNTSQISLTIMPPLPEPKFNLYIFNNDIMISSSNITEGDNITISATISNNGARNATDIIVRFYIDDEQIEDDKQINRLNIDALNTVSVKWTAVSGNHSVKVEIIPSLPALESNALDNVLEETFNVKDKTDPPDPPGGGGAGKSDEGADYTMIIIAVVVIIIVVLLVMFLVLSKRKSKQREYYESMALSQQIQEPIQEPVLEPVQEPMVGEPQYPASEQPYGQESYILEPEPSQELEQPEDVPQFEQEQLVEQAVEEPSYQDTVAGPEQITDATIDDEYGETPIEPGAFEVEDTEGVEPIEQVESEQIQEYESAPAPMAQEIQGVPCPICNNVIPAYSNPCPSCNTELNWE